MLVEGATYRFNRTDKLRYYRAARTKAGMDFLYPIQVNGTRLAGAHKNGRRYVLIYLSTCAQSTNFLGIEHSIGAESSMKENVKTREQGWDMGL